MKILEVITLFSPFVGNFWGTSAMQVELCMTIKCKVTTITKCWGDKVDDNHIKVLYWEPLPEEINMWLTARSLGIRILLEATGSMIAHPMNDVQHINITELDNMPQKN